MFSLKGKSILLGTCLNKNAENPCMLPERMRENRPVGTPKSFNIINKVSIFPATLKSQNLLKLLFSATWMVVEDLFTEPPMLSYYL